MSLKESHINKKAAAGAALVALSGFVPQPLMQPASAATATISVTGSFVTGITLVAGDNIQFGSAAATAGAGSLVISTAGAVTYNSAVKVGGTAKAGTLNFKAVSTTPTIDITVAGLKTVAIATGSATFNKLTLDKFNATTVKLTHAGGSTAKALAVALTAAAKTTTIKVGGTLTWSGGTSPIGAFAEALVFTIAY